MENVRYIDANVDIYYGNEETSEIKSTEASQQNTPTRLKDLYRSPYDCGYKPFTLEGSFPLGEGRAIVDKLGWWGTVLSSKTAQETNVYPFPQNELPCLITEFTGSRIIRKIDIFGDNRLNEFPTRFMLTMYDEYKNIVFNNNFANNHAQSQILLKDDGSYLADDNGKLIKVRWVKLTLIAWNKPGRLSKIYRFYDDIMETYKYEDVKEFEVTHEKVNNGEIKYGLCSDTCTATIYNKNRKFDRGYLKNMIHLNKMMVPHVNGKSLGYFYIKEWNFSQDGMFVKCLANDRLIDFQTIIYPGRMPYRMTDIVDTSKWSDEDTDSLRKEQETQRVTFYHLFKEVLEYAAETAYIKQFEFSIDPALKDYMVSPYVRKDTVWAVLQKLCDATLSHIYIDENDVLIVESSLPAKTPVPQAMSRAANLYSVSVLEPDNPPFPKMAEEEESNETIQINTSNAFSMDVPYFADMVANEVDIGYFTRKVGDSFEVLYSLKVFNLEPKKTYLELVILDDIFDDIMVENSLSDNLCEVHLNYRKGCSYEFSIKNLTNETLEAIYFAVLGKKIEFTKITLPKEKTVDDPLAFRYPYTHPDSELIQSEEYANELKKLIIAQHPEDTKCATVQWRGDLKLNLDKNFELINRFGDKELYKCSYSKITIQGGMRQETKGVLIKNNM